MQVRNYANALEARHAMLKMRPNLRQSWLGLAVAYHLNGRLDDAREVLVHYMKIVKVNTISYNLIVRVAHWWSFTMQNVPDHDIEHSDVMLYYLKLLIELERYSEALELIDLADQHKSIVDRVALLECRGLRPSRCL